MLTEGRFFLYLSS